MYTLLEKGLRRASVDCAESERNANKGRAHYARQSRGFSRHSRADDQDAPAEPQPSESNLVFDRRAVVGGARKDRSRNSSERSPGAAAQRGPSARRPSRPNSA